MTVWLTRHIKLTILSACSGREFQHKLVCSFLWHEKTQCLLQSIGRGPIQRGLSGRAYLQQFVHGCLQVCHLVLMLPLHTCHNILHFLSLLQTWNQSCESWGWAGASERGFHWTLQRLFVRTEPEKLIYILLIWGMDTYWLFHIAQVNLFRDGVEIWQFTLKGSHVSSVNAPRSLHSPYLPHLWPSALLRWVAAGCRPPALTADCSSFPRICVNNQTYPLTRQEGLSSRTINMIHSVSFHMSSDNRFSCTAVLRALVRQLRDQPQVREGQASKNRLHWFPPVDF